jgi:hypothetical protein
LAAAMGHEEWGSIPKFEFLNQYLEIKGYTPGFERMSVSLLISDKILQKLRFRFKPS